LREYRQYYGSEPSERELCHLLGVDREKLHTIQENARIGQIKSLSEVVDGEEEDFTIEDTIASDEDIEADVAERLDTAAMKKELWIAVDQLPKEQSEVIRKRYQQSMTRKDTGEALGIAAGVV
jgi:DNA-directed RNA polymerase specialized sigma subunit